MYALYESTFYLLINYVITASIMPTYYERQFNESHQSNVIEYKELQ